MTFDELKDLWSAFSERLSKAPVGIYASSAAFFLFTALVPLVMLACSILPFTSLTSDDVVGFVMKFAPSTVEEFIRNIVSSAWQASSSGLIIVSTIVALWLASVAMLAIIRGLNVIYRVKKHRTYLLLRCIAALYTLVFMILMLVLVLVMMFGESVGNLIVGVLPEAEARVTALLSLRYIVSALLLVIVFQCVYAFIPSENQPFKRQLPGAVFSSLVWTGASVLFSHYVTSPGAYSMYGSMATIVIMLIYAYMMIYILFLGAQINAFLMEQDAQGAKAQDEISQLGSAEVRGNAHEKRSTKREKERAEPPKA
ncbi:MAG: YihY/virulence factor BrkB family protein [Coriobacteriales bacterium]